MSTGSQSPRKRPTKGKAARSRRQARSANQAPSQAELKAMEARARATIIPDDPGEPEEIPEAIAVVAEPPPTRRTGSRSQSADRQRKRKSETPVRRTLTKAQEYAFIRSDMRRLLYTAGPLLLLMLALLFVIDR